MAQRLCKCGHRKYKHQDYPTDSPHCKALPWRWYGDDDSPIILGCLCHTYEPISNLEYLEICYTKSVDKNKRTRKV